MANNRENKSVIQDWVANELSWEQQMELFKGIRVPDGIMLGEVGREISNYLQEAVFKSIDEENGSPSKLQLLFNIRWNTVKTLGSNIGRYSFDYIIDVMHAAELIGYNHPDRLTAMFWDGVYKMIVGIMHVNPETKEENEARLNAVPVE